MRSLERLVAALDRRRSPVRVFFRDDDLGWGNDRAVQLWERMRRLGVPLDFAVIPSALHRDSAAAIIRMSRQNGAVVSFHQHGYAHVNHQHQGRKCEFGSDRNAAQQRQDIERGRNRLRELLGTLVDPVFTPPWNRCTQDTCAILADLGFEALSRIRGSDDLGRTGLADIPISIDWHKRRSGKRLPWAEFCLYAEHYLTGDDVAGIMLHHELMSDEELERLCLFIAGLKESGKVEFRSMLQIVTAARREPGVARDVAT